MNSRRAVRTLDRVIDLNNPFVAKSIRSDCRILRFRMKLVTLPLENVYERQKILMIIIVKELLSPG